MWLVIQELLDGIILKLRLDLGSGYRDCILNVGFLSSSFTGYEVEIILQYCFFLI